MQPRLAPSGFIDCCLKWRSDRKEVGVAREMDIKEAIASEASENYQVVVLNYSLKTVPTKAMRMVDVETPLAGEMRHLIVDKPVKVLKRCTIKSGFSQLNNTDKLSEFDLIAAQPTDTDDLHKCCTEADIDIISLKLEQKSIMRLKLNVIQEAIRRGIYFEIRLAPALRDVAARRYLIGNATTLIRATKGKHIILSSGARDAFETRSPFDFINLACVFGLTQQQAYDALVRNPAEALRKGASRKTFKGIVLVEDKIKFLEENKEDIDVLPSAAS